MAAVRLRLACGGRVFASPCLVTMPRYRKAELAACVAVEASPSTRWLALRCCSPSATALRSFASGRGLAEGSPRRAEAVQRVVEWLEKARSQSELGEQASALQCLDLARKAAKGVNVKVKQQKSVVSLKLVAFIPVRGLERDGSGERLRSVVSVALEACRSAADDEVFAFES
eukprot:TRINITY_DN39512_c0_g1_i1.p1 TRINITY_DN39512_c0_g1~~TRINITY_DN39512_c0_g1_i1.p1  ORF type:complete len:172 (-),score=37.50 TRINITY_DN39512_c0_g1_i1:9-524(-)